MGKQPLNAEEVRRIARLARLTLGEAEIEPLAAELGQILDYISRLATFEFPPGNPIPDGTPDALRLDQPILSTDAAETILEQAPATHRRHFVVPKMIGE